MLFNTLTYAKFFTLVFAASWLLYRHKRLRLGLLLVASYFFYAGWSVKYLPLLFFCSTLDFALGIAIEGARTPRAKKGWLALTLVSNIGILAVFKYWNFGMETLGWLAHATGLPIPTFYLRLALPIGISFFTFMSLSYVIDVYRGEIPACRSYLRYATFIAFFPHLVAGPIVRGRDLLPALDRDVSLTADEGGEALFYIAVGLVKKVIIGDFLALNLVDRVFAAPSSYSGLEALAGIYGYAVQVYCDFSGYTDIAIGSALLLGYRFPKNFDAPFRATNLVDFWRRWHISLSSWLRDYVYIPLGGSRHGRGRKYLNVLLTRVVCGIWHGAAWTFVLFGIIQGAAVAATHALRDAFGSSREGAKAPFWKTAILVALTFHFTAATFVFIRAESVQKVIDVFARVGTLTTFHPNLSAPVLVALAGGLLAQWSPAALYTRAKEAFIRLPAPAQGFVLFAVCAALREVTSAEAVPFVYFQF
ncbi:MAG: MBOAT family protein [Polyangiaceae bacterium]|nr:MBOAT family protein [Polyangiaceae bacterium]